MRSASSSAAAVKLPVYDSAAKGSRELEELRNIWAYRSLIRELVIRDIKIRYKRSVMGIAWTMIAPLFNMVALTLIFSSLLKQQIHSYAAYFLIGSMYWTYFSTATSYAASQTHDANEFAKKTYLPRSVFVLSSTGVALVNLVLSLLPLAIILAISHFRLRWTIVFFPISVVLETAFSLGVGFLIFTVASRFSDIREMYLVFINTWFFITPIVYAPSIVPAKFRFVLWLNPHYYLIQTFRIPLYDGFLPPASVLLFSTAIAFVTLAVGWVFFCRRIDEYAFRS
jgi:ABC-type polysaccharide/polyol phosphate export permease